MNIRTWEQKWRISLYIGAGLLAITVGPVFAVIAFVMVLPLVAGAMLLKWIIGYGNENWGAGPTPDAHVTIKELHRR